MNNKHSHKKILVNGCSHSSSVIPSLSIEDGHAFSWPKILSKNLNCEVINLASIAKDNTLILEETQRYLLNYDDVDHVVVQLTSQNRVCFYNSEYSFQFIPSEPETQFDRLAETRYHHKAHFPLTLKMEYKDFGWKEYNVGDASLFYHKLSTAVKLFNLYFYCSQNNIGLTVYSFDQMGTMDELDDNIFKKIPLKIFIHDDISYGFVDHLNTKFNIGKCGHFDKDAHYYIAEKVAQHIENGYQVKIDPNDMKRYHVKEFMYDYTT